MPFVKKNWSEFMMPQSHREFNPSLTPSDFKVSLDSRPVPHSMFKSANA
jgi:hypothetical protein